MSERNQKQVLIVDDDEMIRELLARALKRSFFSVLAAPDGNTALELFANNAVDVIVLDVNLPDMSGLDVLDAVKSKNPDCEVLIVTGFGSMDIAVKALRKGAIDYIEKPINMDDLSTSLGRALEKVAKKANIEGVQKNTVLVVDDEKSVVAMIGRFFSSEGYEVFSAYDGIQAIETIENNKIDVVITDIRMGDVSGLDVLKKARQCYDDIEVIMITGNIDEKTAVQSLRAGAFDLITKPINLYELLFTAKRAIERIALKRSQSYRSRELKITSEIIGKMNEELERRIDERTKDLTRVQSQLFQTSKLATLGEMSAGLAHELNQPLSGITLTARTIRKLYELNRLTKEEVEKGLSDIEFAVTRMTKIIQHIRTFARQETLKFIQVDVNETIESSLTLLGEQLRLHEIEIVRNLSTELPKIMGEPYQLEQVWINLITNARDAMDEKGERVAKGEVEESGYRKRIEISTCFKPELDSVEVIFKDNGVGLESKEVKDKVFNPFFTTKKVGQSTGLGLSISYGIIESHKGKIELDSEGPQKGVRCRVVLPKEAKGAA